MKNSSKHVQEALEGALKFSSGKAKRAIVVRISADRLGINKNMKDNTFLHNTYRHKFNNAHIRYLKTGYESLRFYNILFKDIYFHIGMCPGTRKEWHLDHIIPLSYFDFNVPEHFELCHRPENLRWLRSRDNCGKSARFIPMVFLCNNVFNIFDLAVYYRKKYYNELLAIDSWMENWRNNNNSSF